MKRLTAAALMTVMLHVGAGISVAQIGGPFPGFPAPHHTQSGMLLGIYAFQTPQGLTVTGTVPGYSAHGRLLTGDILLRATTCDLPTYNISTHHGMEYAKTMIGVNREAAIEFFRPGVGNMYAWVTFLPVNAQPHLQLQGTAAIAQPTQFQAVFQMESEKPGAQALFAAPAVTTAPAAAAAPATGTVPAAAPAETPAQPVTPAETETETPADPPAPATPSSGDDELDSLFK